MPLSISNLEPLEQWEKTHTQKNYGFNKEMKQSLSVP